MKITTETSLQDKTLAPSKNSANAERLLKHLNSREDKVGQADLMSVNVNGRKDIIKKLEKHLSGELRIGLYNKLPDGTVSWAVVEFEGHGPGKVSNPLETARKYQLSLKQRGISSYIERSKSLNEENYHLWLLFACSIEASRVYHTLKALLSELGLNRNVEVFPKTRDANQTGIGNFVWMPFFGGAEDLIDKKLGGGIPSGRTAYLNDEGSVITDVGTFLDSIIPITLEKFNALETSMLPFMASSQDSRVNLKGTGNQLQRMLDNCPFMQWCVENAENLPEPLWWAMISNLCRFDGGPEKVHEISKLDKTPSRYNKAATDAKIQQALEASGPITYKVIKELGWPGEIPAWPKSPAGWGSYADLDGMLEELAGLKGNELRSKLRQHFNSDFHQLPLGQQGEWLTRLAETTRISRKELSRLARASLKNQPLVDSELKDLLVRHSVLGTSEEEKGKLIFDWFVEKGGLVYRNREHRGFWIWDGEVYELGTDQHFCSFIWRIAGITHEGLDSKKIWAVLKAETDTRGILLNSFTWLWTDSKKHRLYMFPNTNDGSLLRIDPNEVTVAANGANDDSVLLAPAAKMTPIDYRELTDAEYVDAWRRYDELVLRNMAATRYDQLLYGTWSLCYPLIDFVKTLPHMRCEGESGAGKSRAMDLVSYFVYGESQIKKATDAANYADGSTNPVILLDNVETRNFGELSDFFLMASTGITKEKRKRNTDRETVLEKVHCLVNSNGIENLGKTEHINRTLSVAFNRWTHKSPDWSEEVYADIAAERPTLFAAHMTLISKVLARIADGGIKRWINWLEQNHPGHAKDRANSFIAIMALVLEELNEVLSLDVETVEIVDQWIKLQNNSGYETSVDSNSIVTYLESVYSDIDKLQPPVVNHFQVKYNSIHKTLQGTANQFFGSFGMSAKIRGIRYEFTNPMQVAKRFKDMARSLQTTDPAYDSASDAMTYYTSRFSMTVTKNSSDVNEYLFCFSSGVLPSGYLQSDIAQTTSVSGQTGPLA